MGDAPKPEAPATDAPPERPHRLRILRHAMVPLADADGRARHVVPYRPVKDACQVCPARCCRLNVKVSVPDALHFCETLGLPFFAGLTLVASSSERAFRVQHDARLFPDIDPSGWGGAAEIMLRRRDDGGCSFLQTIGGYERCGVYSVRPSTCRLYPITWDSDVAKGGPAMVMCPVPYAITPEVEDAFYRDAELSIGRWALHDELLAAWHAEVADEARTVEAWLAFAFPRAAERMGLRVVHTLDTNAPFERLRLAMVASGVIRG